MRVLFLWMIRLSFSIQYGLAGAISQAWTHSDSVGMMPPLNRNSTGDLAPAEARSVAIVKIHQMIAAVVIKRPVLYRKKLP